mmetsp:Transcript_36077/g.57988  ORF Transcript_36077/g.57988 Transcript_36077/m.57988 type:complete len:682 (+) Transcript_36077:217-2262(+)
MPVAVARSALSGLLLALRGGRGRAPRHHTTPRARRVVAAGAPVRASVFHSRTTRVLSCSPACTGRPKLADARRSRPAVHAAVRAVSFAPPRLDDFPSSSFDVSEEDDVQLRAIVTMEPGAAVVCTPEEEAIFATLLAVVKHHELPVTLRVAGGWVRDKLLGKQSADIDIALDSMLGREFAELVNEYLRAKGEKTHGVGVIQSNPDQSKHLETATMRVHDVWLDLVNLRAENYSDQSRIPEMTFGSATDDAFRRDLTINSLFYNINLRCVEDFTGAGLEDLQKGIVRTPLPPRTTFLDDPLRILRAVRFASRFGFSLDPSIVHAATDAEVQTALRTKVSRERVGKEVSGMLRGPSPGDALTLLCRFELFTVVFAHSVHADALVQMPEGTAWGCLHAARSLDALLAAHTNAGGAPFAKAFSGEEREWLLLAAFLLPLSALSFPGKKNKLGFVVDTVVKEALKLRVKDADVVNLILGLAEEMRGGLLGCGPHSADQLERGSGSFSRVEAGKLMRRGKEHWRLALLLGAVLEMPGVAVLGDGAELAPWVVESAQAPPVAEPLVGGHGSPLHAFSESNVTQVEGSGSSDAAAAARVRASATLMAARVRAAEDTILAMQLDQVWELKPLLNGQAVMRAVGMEKGGPALGKLNEQLVEWQLEHPAGTEEDATAFLRVVGPGVMAANQR